MNRFRTFVLHLFIPNHSNVLSNVLKLVVLNKELCLRAPAAELVITEGPLWSKPSSFFIITACVSSRSSEELHIPIRSTATKPFLYFPSSHCCSSCPCVWMFNMFHIVEGSLTVSDTIRLFSLSWLNVYIFTVVIEHLILRRRGLFS